MSAGRSVLMAFLVLLLAAVTGVMLLYAYRAQSPSGPVGTPDAMPMMGVALLPMLLLAVVPMAVLFLVVYAAVRLAISHERRAGREPRI